MNNRKCFLSWTSDKDDHKALYRAAKRFAKVKGERENLLTTSKKKVDAAQDKLIALMHENKMKKWRHAGVKTELIASSEKVEVRTDDDVQDDPDDDTIEED